MFGKMFFEFCQESGYDTILRVLGSNVREFLQVNSLLFACKMPVTITAEGQIDLEVKAINNIIQSF